MSEELVICVDLISCTVLKSKTFYTPSYMSSVALHLPEIIQSMRLEQGRRHHGKKWKRKGGNPDQIPFEVSAWGTVIDKIYSDKGWFVFYI